MDMRVFTSALFLLLCAVPVFAGGLISREEAERLFFENNVELKLKQAELRRADADVTGARAVPNPVAGYEVESFPSGGREKEETFSLSQELDLFGKRGKRIETASRRRDAVVLQADYETSILLARMRRTYQRVLLLRENGGALEAVAGQIADVEAKIKARFREGDVSEAEVMKLVAERNKVLRDLGGVKADLGAEKGKLGVLLGIAGDFDVAALMRDEVPEITRQETIGRALEARKDIKAQETRLDAARAGVSLSRREAFPAIELEGKYKKTSIGFDGYIFGVKVPLPLFDRRQGGAGKARAEMHWEAFTLERMKQEALAEVNSLTLRFTYLRSALSGMGEDLAAARDLTVAARLRYEEGEVTLLELLEAVRSEKNLVMEFNDKVFECWSTLFELERAVGMELIQSGGKS